MTSHTSLACVCAYICIKRSSHVKRKGKHKPKCEEMKFFLFFAFALSLFMCFSLRLHLHWHWRCTGLFLQVRERWEYWKKCSIIRSSQETCQICAELQILHKTSLTTRASGYRLDRSSSSAFPAWICSTWEPFVSFPAEPLAPHSKSVSIRGKLFLK